MIIRICTFFHLLCILPRGIDEYQCHLLLLLLGIVVIIIHVSIYVDVEVVTLTPSFGET